MRFMPYDVQDPTVGAAIVMENEKDKEVVTQILFAFADLAEETQDKTAADLVYAIENGVVRSDSDEVMVEFPSDSFLSMVLLLQTVRNAYPESYKTGEIDQTIEGILSVMDSSS